VDWQCFGGQASQAVPCCRRLQPAAAAAGPAPGALPTCAVWQLVALDSAAATSLMKTETAGGRLREGGLPDLTRRALLLNCRLALAL
jgi:hypothetical protein